MSLLRATTPLLLAAHLVSSALAAEGWTTIRDCLPDDLRMALWNGREYLGIGRRGVLFSSPDGVRWTSKGLGPKVPVNRFLFREGEYLTAGDSGIHRSVDLQTWTRVHASEAPLWGLSAWGDTLVAVGDSGQILRRVGDGSWKAMVSGTRKRLYFASKAAGMYYVGGTSWLGTSHDGATWFPTSTPFSDIYGLEAFGSSLLVISYSGVNFSRDSGRSWRPVVGNWVGIPTRIVRNGNQVLIPTTAGSVYFLAGDSVGTRVPIPLGDVQDLVLGGPNAVAVGRDGRIAYASDLSKWKTEYRWQTGVSHAAGRWFVTSSEQTLYSSTNGWDWKTDSTPTRILRKVVETPQGFLAIGKVGTTQDYESDRYIFGSADGVAWKNNFSVQIRGLRDIARFGSQTFVVGDYGAALHSTDGASWSSIPFTSTINLQRIFVAHDRIFLCGDSLYTSTDGKNWTVFNVPYIGGQKYSYIESIVHTGKEYVAAARGTLYYSKDGLEWTPEEDGEVWKWTKLFWNGKEIVALTDGGWKFATSPDGRSWTIASDSLSEPIVDVAVDGTKAMAIGNRGTVLVLGDFPTTGTRVRPRPIPRSTGRHAIDGRALSPVPPGRLGTPRY